MPQLVQLFLEHVDASPSGKHAVDVELHVMERFEVGLWIVELHANGDHRTGLSAAAGRRRSRQRCDEKQNEQDELKGFHAGPRRVCG